MKKLGSLAIGALLLAGCGGGGGSLSSSSGNGGEEGLTKTPITESLSFKDYGDQNEKRFNESLFYRNDLTLDMGDPMVVYDQGYFYAFGTRGTDRFYAFRSKGLTTWEEIDDAFYPESTSWSRSGLWAPDVHKIGDKWYLYYTGEYFFNDRKESRCQIGVAVSDNPYGPYKQVAGPDGTLGSTPFAFKKADGTPVTILDQNVFEDEDGSLYMYFSYDMRQARDGEYHGYPVQEIWGVKMTSPTSWDLSTLTRLLSPGLAKLSDEKRTIEWETWSTSFAGEMECLEGPYMIKKNGTYYLTYVGNSYVDTVYNVGYATSSSPLGEFVKPNKTPLDNMLLGVPANDGSYLNTRYLGFMTGTGHASIVNVEGEYMFAYHAHQNRDIWGKDGNYNRALGLDYLYFDKDGTPYTRGPTWSINRLPNAVTGYHNLAQEAGVTYKGTGTSLEKLFDNRTMRDYNPNVAGLVRPEADFKAGENIVRIDLGAKKKVKFLEIANSAAFDLRLDYIDGIAFDGGKGVKDVLFNQKYVRKTPNKWMYPHSSFIIELETEVETQFVELQLSSGNDFALGEIEIYGR